MTDFNIENKRDDISCKSRKITLVLFIFAILDNTFVKASEEP